MAEETARSSGWWSRFVALFAGVPPIAVHALDDEDDEPGLPERRQHP